MSDALRRAFNAVDSLFDGGAITEELRFSRDGGESERPQRARCVFQRVETIAREQDRQARLKSIVSQQGVDAGGASEHWEFFFELPRRRAQLVCEWILPWDEARDDYGRAVIEVVVRPFPAADGPIRQMVREGRLLHRQLQGLWEVERKRRPDLPHRFRDTDAALAEFVRQGLDVTRDEFSLSTGPSPEGRACWIAHTKTKSYCVALDE